MRNPLNVTFFQPSSDGHRMCPNSQFLGAWLSYGKSLLSALVIFGCLGHFALASFMSSAFAAMTTPAAELDASEAPAPSIVDETVQDQSGPIEPVSVPSIPESSLLRIGTGALGGTYFTIGQALATIFSHPENAVHCKTEGRCGPKGLAAVVQTSDGSVRNALAVHAGSVASALIQSDILNAAYLGSGLFDENGALDNLRIIATLYPETLHLVVRAQDEIYSMDQLADKTVSSGLIGSGTHATVVQLFGKVANNAYNINYVDLSPYDAADKMIDGEIDGFFTMGGAPVPLVRDLIANGTGRLISPLNDDRRALINQSDHWHIGNIEAKTYPMLRPGSIKALSDPSENSELTESGTNSSSDVREPKGHVESVQVSAVLVVSASMSEERAYQLTKALWHPDNKRILDASHPQGQNIQLKSAVMQSRVPLHLGAAKYYRQVGVLIDYDEKPSVLGDPSEQILIHDPEEQNDSVVTPPPFQDEAIDPDLSHGDRTELDPLPISKMKAQASNALHTSENSVTK